MWNKKEEASKRAVVGLWVVSPDTGTERLVTSGAYAPLGWSPDGRWIYAAVGSHNSVVRIGLESGEVQPWVTLPIGESEGGDCHMGADPRQIACVNGAESDVWLVDDFDKILAKR